MEQIVIRFIEKPDPNDAESIIRWFCDVFGLSNRDDENPIEAQILKCLVEATREGKGVSSSGLDLETKISRTTVIYHLNRFIDAGLVVKRGRKYFLRAAQMQTVIQEMGYDLEREMKRLLDTARQFDIMLQGTMIGSKSRVIGATRR